MQNEVAEALERLWNKTSHHSTPLDLHAGGNTRTTYLGAKTIPNLRTNHSYFQESKISHYQSFRLWLNLNLFISSTVSIFSFFLKEKKKMPLLKQDIFRDKK